MTLPLSERPIAVFDIDGVLADVTHRLHHIQGSSRRWDRFFRSADRDLVLAEGARRLRAALVDHDVVYLTGRPERTRQLTEHWLARHGLPTGPLIMRDDRDHSPAPMLKLGELRRLARHRTIASVLDDDPSVVGVLKADGWPVELATWLPHSSTLEKAQDELGLT